jgi:U32 family peptidase
MEKQDPVVSDTKVELMAPAGSWESLQAALQAGADSIYFGAGHLQMRSRSAAFALGDIEKVVATARERGAKAYLTLNTVVYDTEYEEVQRILDACSSAQIDAVIAADPYVLEAARERELSIHLSTQANASNLGAVRFYARYADVMVLARELNLEQIRAIVTAIERDRILGPSGQPVKIEIFAHGALCVAISGRCYMSLAQHGTSANRGDCYQMCRRTYAVADKETGFSYDIDNQWVMSPKDLCTLPTLDRMLSAGVRVLKIEGRGRSPDYVHTVVRSYRHAIDSWQSGNWSEALVNEEMERLRTVFNRGFWEGGYYLGEKQDPWARSGGSQATRIKTYIGKVENYYRKSGIAQVLLEAGDYNLGQELLITGPTTGVVEFRPTGFEVNDQGADYAPQRSVMTFPLPTPVRINDKVYVITQANR